MELNELTPREHDAMRDRVTGGVRRMRAARVRRSRVVAGVAAVALVGVVVTGVTFAALQPDGRVATPVETVTPSPAPSEIPTPTPTPTPTLSPAPTAAPLSQPALAFGGDCNTVVSSSRLAEALGEPEPESEVWSVHLPEVATLGGIDCRWISVGVMAYAFPVTAVDSEIRERYVDPVCEGYLYDGSGCRIALESTDTWMLVTAHAVLSADGSAPGRDDAATIARLQAVLPFFEEAFGRAGAPVAATRTDAWWPPITCDDLQAEVPISEILGTDDFTTGYPSGFGTDVQFEIAERAGLGQICRWYAPTSEPLDAVIFTLYPGAAWDWERLATGPSVRNGEPPTVESVTVDGAESAVRWQGALRPDSSTLIATDGVNVLQVMEAPDVVRAAELALAALNGGEG